LVGHQSSPEVSKLFNFKYHSS